MRSRLQTRFLLVGGLLVATAAGGSVWSALTFLRLKQVMDEAIRASQEIIDLGAALHSSLEREDDALLLFLSGDFLKAQNDLKIERQRGDARFERLANQVEIKEQRALVVALRRWIDEYRAAGDALLNPNAQPGGLEQYHLRVNPLLRQAVLGCDQLREMNFRSMREASLRVRDEAARNIRLVLAISVSMIGLGVAVSVWLARTILVPIRDLIESVEAIRRGDFDRRVQPVSSDELGQLGMGFNRMAETLSEYRRSSVGTLLAAKTTLEATLNALPDAVMVFEPDGTLASANPLAKRILAARGFQASGRLENLAISSDFVASVRAALSGRPPAARRMDFAGSLCVLLDSEKRRFVVTSAPIAEFTPGRFGAVVVMDDVTEFARLDELRSELVAVASHELKSPLTTLLMNLLMLREGAADFAKRHQEIFAKRHQEILEAAVAGCEELGQIIDELLDLTRIEAGQLRLATVPVELGALIAAARQPLQARFDDAGIRLEVRMPPTSVVLIGDPKRLQSVLINILDNALKYSPAGGVIVVEVEVPSPQNARLPNQRVVQMTVTDRGPGVPAEFRERIFEKFFRVEHYRPSSGNIVWGSGIGLYLCHQIIKSHGGRITCETGPDGVGTRIVVTLPLKL